MTEKEKEAMKTLSIKAATSKAECEDYPNCICLKKDLLLILNLIDKQDNKIKELEKAVEEKEKTILKMAKAINNFNIDEDICKQMGQKKYCSEYDEESECEKCIIEYFEKKEEKNLWK